MADASARSGSDGGSATAELAVALPAVVLALTAVVAAGQAVAGQVACVDAARAAARAASRGDSQQQVVELARGAAGGGAGVGVTVGAADPVVVEVRRELRLLLPAGPRLRLKATATAQREQPSSGAPGGTDLGSATVLVLAAVLLALVLAVSGLVVGSATVARHRAQSAADLAALAGASALSGSGPAGTAPCTAAAAVAARNGAWLTSCTVQAGAVASGPSVLVRAAVPPVGPAARWGAAHAVARAGTAGAVSSPWSPTVSTSG